MQPRRVRQTFDHVALLLLSKLFFLIPFHILTERYLIFSRSDFQLRFILLVWNSTTNSFAGQRNGLKFPSSRTICWGLETNGRSITAVLILDFIVKP